MSSKPLFRIAPLNAAQDRITFNSGSEPLDHYFKQQVTQDVHRRVTACFVALTHEETIAGYYTLASASLELADLPPDIEKKNCHVILPFRRYAWDVWRWLNVSKG